MLRFHLASQRQQEQLDHSAGPFEKGGGPPGEERAAIGDHLCIEELPGGQVRVENRSREHSVGLADNGVLAPGATIVLTPPVCLNLGATQLRIEPGDTGSLATSATTPARAAAPARPASAGTGSLATSATVRRLPLPADLPPHWADALIAVHRTADAPELFQRTARAVVDLVGLDRALVLLRQGDGWVVRASVPPETPEAVVSRAVLERLVEEKRSLWSLTDLPSPAPGAHATGLAGAGMVMAAPVLAPTGDVMGALYGIRSQATDGQGVGAAEAQLLDLVASAVGLALARAEQEQAALSARDQLEQFFTPELARELARSPNLLTAKEQVVTVMFSDIRWFSRMSEKLGPTNTCRLVYDVMDHMTERVREFDGVVVDYYGDGLCAMWNAPAEQSDHAARACRAALAILADLPAVSAAWEQWTGEPIELGIGLNTGPAMVGNIGSPRKFKYGPLGHAVNLASRVQGATKHLGIPALMAGSTHALLGGSFATRRLGQVRVVNVRDPEYLYELHAEVVTPEWSTRRDAYEKALDHCENRQWAAAFQALEPLLIEGRQRDIPTLDLASRALECMKKPRSFDVLFELPGK
jgi:adenylate cyclase